jgi:hypothetical protein
LICMGSDPRVYLRDEIDRDPPFFGAGVPNVNL